jgi:hypothetical protein
MFSFSGFQRYPFTAWMQNDTNNDNDSSESPPLLLLVQLNVLNEKVPHCINNCPSQMVMSLL